MIGYPNLTYLLIGQNFVNIMITELSERRIDLHPEKRNEHRAINNPIGKKSRLLKPLLGVKKKKDIYTNL